MSHDMKFYYTFALSSWWFLILMRTNMSNRLWLMPVNILVTSPPHPDLEDDDADDEGGGGDSHKLWQATLSPAFQASPSCPPRPWAWTSAKNSFRHYHHNTVINIFPFSKFLQNFSAKPRLQPLDPDHGYD